jgi:hypothetical protein
LKPLKKCKQLSEIKKEDEKNRKRSLVKQKKTKKIKSGDNAKGYF